jgi:hypothetical protein
MANICLFSPRHTEWPVESTQPRMYSLLNGENCFVNEELELKGDLSNKSNTEAKNVISQRRELLCE